MKDLYPTNSPDVGFSMVEKLNTIAQEMNVESGNLPGLVKGKQGTATDVEFVGGDSRLPELGDLSNESKDVRPPADGYKEVEGDSMQTATTSKPPARGGSGENVESDSMLGWKPSPWSGISLPKEYGE